MVLILWRLLVSTVIILIYKNTPLISKSLIFKPRFEIQLPTSISKIQRRELHWHNNFSINQTNFSMNQEPKFLSELKINKNSNMEDGLGGIGGGGSAPTSVEFVKMSLGDNDFWRRGDLGNADLNSLGPRKVDWGCVGSDLDGGGEGCARRCGGWVAAVALTRRLV